jgi:hypothetical protein
MNMRAGQRPATEAPVLLGDGVGVQSLEHIPRKWKRDAIRVLLDLGIKATPDQALRLLHDWREERANDARRFIAEEFRAYIKCRGDLIQIRGQRRHEWRTTT